ncbi:MAG: aminopeptidase [Spirochaetota bacterium]
MAEEKKSPNQELQEKISIKKESAWIQLKDKVDSIYSFGEEYKSFIGKNKTERLCIRTAIEMLEKAHCSSSNTKDALKPGDAVYKNIKGKSLVACKVGSDPMNVRIIGAHVDSPRLDLKPYPLYEDAEVALLKSHYYGGIKKYQWVNIPLAIHGVAFTKEGKTVEIHIGENPDEPRFIIPDLLPHLAKDQMKKTGETIIEGEDLNIVFAHMPVDDKDIKEKIKFNVLKYLHSTYGLIEEDFVAADIELVPAFAPVDIGIDRGLIAAYGQDDRACAYTALRALIDSADCKETVILYLADREEIGSMGDTGAESFVFINFMREYIRKTGITTTWDELLENALAISADVTGALDPTFKSVNDPNNVSYLGHGVSIEKYGGRGGKYSTSEAHAEYMHYLRSLADRHGIPWQTGEQGKIDIGGGGTIAMFMSRYGMDCVDAGPCMLGMHSPFEVTSKVDIYCTYLLYKAFFEDAR